MNHMHSGVHNVVCVALAPTSHRPLASMGDYGVVRGPPSAAAAAANQQPGEVHCSYCTSSCNDAPHAVVNPLGDTARAARSWCAGGAKAKHIDVRRLAAHTTRADPRRRVVMTTAVGQHSSPPQQHCCAITHDTHELGGTAASKVKSTLPLYQRLSLTLVVADKHNTMHQARRAILYCQAR